MIIPPQGLRGGAAVRSSRPLGPSSTRPVQASWRPAATAPGAGTTNRAMGRQTAEPWVALPEITTRLMQRVRPAAQQLVRQLKEFVAWVVSVFRLGAATPGATRHLGSARGEGRPVRDMRPPTTVVRSPGALQPGTDGRIRVDARTWHLLGDDMTLSGDVTLDLGRGTAVLPRRLHVCGNLTVQRANLTTLPADLRVDGDLTLIDVTGFNIYPVGIVVGGSLRLRNCSLMRMPSSLHVRDNFELTACRHIRALPTELIAGGQVRLAELTQLHHMPQVIDAGHLWVVGCPRITRLAQHVRVVGDIDVARCPSFRHLPHGETFHGNFHLLSAHAVTDTRPILSWGTRLDGGLREVSLGAGFRPSTFASTAARLAPGWPFEDEPFGALAGPSAFRNPAPPNFATARPNMPQTESLPRSDSRISAAPFAAREILATWEALTPDSGPWMQEVWDLSPEHHSTLRAYLRNLTQTADYKSVAGRPHLAQRLHHVIAAMDADRVYRALAFDIMHLALDSCHDRVILAMNDLEVAYRVQEASRAEDPEAALRKLAWGCARLEAVRACAQQTCQREEAARRNGSYLQWLGHGAVDEIEIHLYYETQLARRLELPVSSQSMLYGAPVYKRDLQAAVQAAHEAVQPGPMQTFLNAWHPWQTFLRQRRVRQELADPMGLPVRLVPTFAVAGPCVFTQETADKLIQAVYLDGPSTTWVFEHEDIVRWWAAEGVHPLLRTPLTELDLYRLPTV